MNLNQELIDKCIKINVHDKVYLKNKLYLYSKYKKDLKASNNYQSFIVNLSYCYIIAYSLYDNSLEINKIISEELLENLNNYLEEIKDKNGAWELDDETIIRKIEWILDNFNVYKEI